MPRKSMGPRGPITPEQSAEMDVAVDESFTLESLSPEARADAQRLAQSVSAALLKGLLHRIDPSEFPLEGGPDDPAVVSAAMAGGLSDRTLAHLAPRLRAMQAEPAKLKSLLSGAEIDFAEFRRPRMAGALPGLKATRRPILVQQAPRPLPPLRVRRSEPREPTEYRRAHLLLRAIHCVRETQPPGWDSIILGGVLIGASGNAVAIQSLDAGDFRTGHYADFGELYLGEYSLRSTDGYPKNLYAIFKLVESDSDDAEVARELTSVISVIASTIITAYATAAAGAAAEAILAAVGGFITGLIDEDELRPYGIRLKLPGPDPFNGDSDGPKKRTGDITGHGGIYRIGYRWVLGA